MVDTENDRLETKLYENIKLKMNRTTGLSELNAWRNSLKEMYITLNDSDIPKDAGVAIEYNILLLLVKNQGKVFSIEQIYENIWNEDAIGADNTVAVHIRHIREKIEINPKEPRYLKVVWGVGYKVEKN